MSPVVFANVQRKAYEARLKERVLDHTIAAARHQPTHLACAVVAAFAVSRLATHPASDLLFVGVAAYALMKIRSVVLTPRHVAVFTSFGSGVFTMDTFPAGALASEAGPPGWRYTPLTLGERRYWVRTTSLERIKVTKVQWSAEAAEQRRRGGAADDGSSPYVHDGDLYASYGMRVADREVTQDPVVTHSVFHLDGPGAPRIEVFVCDHRNQPGMAAEDESAWQSSGDVSAVPGLGTVAFETTDGALFARLGDSWTVQILAPDTSQTRLSAGRIRLMEGVLARLESIQPER